MNIVDKVRENNGQVKIFSSLHVSGEQLLQLTGIAAILRFPMSELEEEALSDSDDEDTDSEKISNDKMNSEEVNASYLDDTSETSSLNVAPVQNTIKHTASAAVLPVKKTSSLASPHSASSSTISSNNKTAKSTKKAANKATYYNDDDDDYDGYYKNGRSSHYDDYDDY